MVEIKKCPICGDTHQKSYLTTTDYFLTKESFSLTQCEGCGFIITSPRPDDKDLSRYYESDAYLSHHARGFSPLRLVYQFLRKRNIRSKYKLIYEYVPTGKILDIGCGTGELLSYFKNQGWDTTGVEPDSAARKFAVENYALDVFDEKEISKFSKNTFDVITMWHVLEHVNDINGRVQDIFSLLKKGGYFIAALPNPAAWDAQHYKQYWAAWDLPRHLFHFSQKNIIQLSEIHGFKHVNTYPMKWDAYYISLMSEQYKGHSFPYFNAIKNGMKSNNHAVSGRGYSSMIYLFQKV
jgi:2-polyprenyl-3-methyl-5-hydroxy-6-metoxy-1,4-benzoquinol methylase